MKTDNFMTLLILFVIGLVAFVVNRKNHKYTKKVQNYTTMPTSERQQEAYDAGIITSWEKENPYIEIANLSNNSKVLTCKRDSVNIDKWPYDNTKVKKGNIFTTMYEVPRRVKLGREGDEILWISNLVPGEAYSIILTVYSNINENVKVDQRFDYLANENGVIFIADAPFPTAITVYTDIIFELVSKNSIPDSTKVNQFHSVVDVDNANPVLVDTTKNESVTVVYKDQKILLCGDYSDSGDGIQVVYNVLTNEERMKYGANPVNMNMLTSRGPVNITFKNGKIYI